VLHNEALVQAFAKVPRERFLDPGPWRVIPPGRAAYTTTDADPRWLYYNVLVVIDEGRDLNNGEPRLWAYLFDHLYVRPGERVLHVGTGTGYYSAILREMTGQAGSVIALEYDDPSPDQREIAAGSLAAPGGTTEESSRWFHRPGFWLSRTPLSSRLEAGWVANW
jgi:protein-L-isoaspartate(D-aspartate) O-methyltransferase